MSLSENPSGIPALQDEELFIRFKQRSDMAAFTELVKRYQKYLVNMFYRLTSELPSAEDMAQEVFLRLVKGCNDYTPSAKFSTFLYGLARHLWIDHLKKETFLHKISLEQPIGDDQKNKLSDLLRIKSDTPAEAAEKASDIQRMKEAIRDLPTEHRLVVELMVFQELSYDEVAILLEIPPGTVRSRMSKAIQKLKDLIVTKK